VKIFIIGAGQVGATVVEALHDEHELTVIDLDEERLAASRSATTSPRSRGTARAGASSPPPASPRPTS
jgi:predicted dinucleotide-binding enzyme